MAKRGKQIKSYISYDYNIVFGTINNDEPKAIYTIISGWMNPKDDTINNYNSIMIYPDLFHLDIALILVDC